jgi:uncharacterized membrane protein (DUF485 family)
MMNYAGGAIKADEVPAEINTACWKAMAVQADVANNADLDRLLKKQRTITVVANCTFIMTFIIYFFILSYYLTPFILGILVSNNNRS